VKVTPFVPSDYQEATAGAVSMGNPQVVAEMFATKGPAFTARQGACVIACAGVMLFWPGVGEAWSVLSPCAAEHPMIHRHVKRGLAGIIESHGLWRVQATVLDGFAKGERWITRLGFQFESAMPAFGPKGETYNRYAIVRKHR